MYAYYIQGRHDARDYFEAHKHEHVSRETFMERAKIELRHKKLQAEKGDQYYAGWQAVADVENDYFTRGL